MGHDYDREGLSVAAADLECGGWRGERDDDGAAAGRVPPLAARVARAQAQPRRGGGGVPGDGGGVRLRRGRAAVHAAGGAVRGDPAGGAARAMEPDGGGLADVPGGGTPP